MAEHVTAVFQDSSSTNDAGPCRDVLHVSRIEISGDDRTKVVFYTNPQVSSLECRNGDEFHLETVLSSFFGPEQDRIPLFGEEALKLVAVFKRGSIKELWIGTNRSKKKDLLDPWRKKKLGSFEIADRFHLHEDLFKSFIFQELSFDDVAVRISFVEMAGGGGWTPVFSASAKLTRKKGNLEAFGFLSPIGEDKEVQLVQLPESVYRFPHQLAKKGRRWFLAIRDLPYSWGRSVWNDVMSEQIRVLASDSKHRSFFLPLLSNNSNSNLGWDLLFDLEENPVEKPAKKPVTHALRLWTRQDASVRAQLPLLRDHRGLAVQADLAVAKRLQPASDGQPDFGTLQESFERPGLSIRLGTTVTVTSPGNPVVRIGALDVHLRDSSPSPSSFPTPELRWRLVPNKVPGSGDAYQIQESLVQFHWAVERVLPGGQDKSADPFPLACDGVDLDRFDLPPSLTDREAAIDCAFSRQQPLVIPDPFGDQPAAPSDLLLELDEQRTESSGLQLKLRIFANSPQAGNDNGNAEDEICTDGRQRDRVIVLDPDPFFAALVAYEPLGSLRDDQGTEVANWSNNGLAAETWHMHLPSRQGFCLTLPPQGVGEAMERYQTLDRNELADFRLTPPARLSMRATYFEQSFPEAPWNLRNLLTHPGRELAGAELEMAHLELLYGLSCHLDVHDDLVRLAEVLTLIGDVPGPQPQAPWSSVARKWLGQRKPAEQNAWDLARLRWSRFHRQLRARLAVFETWDAARLATLQRREGVTCWIRVPASFYPEGEPPKAPKELRSLPPAELAHPIDTLGRRPVRTGPPDPNERSPADLCPPADGSLCGGVTWGFESRNVFDAVVRPTNGEWPRSTVAELDDLRLSALGAWGHQMSAFDAGLTTIYGDVAMGRTYAYRVERVGRIGCFWHRAKHVIVYERTVVPSRQFASDQNPLGGRPILRKVREYVEILENKRSYPDTPDGAPMHVGFIRRVTFGETPDEVVRFHVKSAWGTDLSFKNGAAEEKGWKVPLWIAGAEPIDVFPRPRVQVTVLSVIDGETREVERFLDNPENLVFFTRTTNSEGDKKAADTDSWPPVPGIDWVDCARPETQKDQSFLDGRLDQSAAADRLVPAGHAPITFLLEPSPHGANLTVHREGEAMAAAVRSFTMTRSAAAAGTPGGVSLEAVAKGVETSFATVLAQLPGAGALGEAQRKEIKKALDEVTKKADEIHGQIINVRKGVERWHEVSPDTMIESARQASLGAANQALDRLVGAASGSELEKALRAVVDEMLRDGGAPSADKLEPILERELAVAVTSIGRKMTLLVPSPLVLSAAILPPIRTAAAGLQQICETGKTLQQQVGAGWKEAVATPERLEREIRSWLEQIERVLDSVAAASQSGPTVKIGDKQLTIPALGRPVIDKIRAGLAKPLELSRQAADWLRREVVRKKVDVANITKELGDQVQQPVTIATNGLVSLCGLEGELRTGATTIEKGIEELERQKLALIQDLEDKLMEQGRILIGQIVGGLKDTDELVHRWIKPAENWLSAAKTNIEDGAKNLDNTVGTLWKPAINTVENAANDVKASAEALKSSLTSGAEDLRRRLEQERDRLLADLEHNFGDELRALETLRAKADEVRAKAEPGLRLIRAFGTPPEVGGLQFDRPEVAFFYQELDSKVGITPVIGRVAQAAAIGRAVGDVLEPLGIDLPVEKLGEKLLPADLKNFDLASIFPNFAGLRLDKLFSGLKMPDPGESVKVRHGIDVQTRRAWFEAEVTTAIDKEAVVFATGPLSLSIVNPDFSGRVRAEVSAGAVRRKVEGAITGDWKLTVGGTEILIIHKTQLDFDEGGQLSFHIRPEQIELPAAMKFITELLKSLSNETSGLTIKIEPTGISSILSLPLPDIQAGSFGIAGLSLGATLALRWLDSDSQGRSGFSIGLAFNLAFPDRPFALTIFILGGGGYLTAESKYFPTTGAIETEVRMAITASASLAIALSVISGGVFVYFGITTRYTVGQGGLYVGILFLIIGRVSVLGIVSASVRLSLEAEYTPDGGLLGRGNVSLEIKICWCFTLRVNKDVTYTLSGKGGNASLLPGAPAWGPQPVAQVASLGSPAAVLPASDGRRATAPTAGDQFHHLREQVRRHLAMLA
jgi:hypothetical protein